MSFDEDILDFKDLNYPQLTLETDDIKMDIVIKKDYSDIKDINERKNQFVNDLKEFIIEFDAAPEAIDFMKFYDEL